MDPGPDDETKAAAHGDLPSPAPVKQGGGAPSGAEAGAGGGGGSGSHVMHVGSPTRDRSTLSEITLGPAARPMPRVTFSEVDEGSVRDTPYRVRRRPSFQLRFGPSDLQGQPAPPSTMGAVMRTSSMVSQRSQRSRGSQGTVGTFRSAAGERMVYPQLPMRSTTMVADGEVVIVSKNAINREIHNYTRARWARCRDGHLSWRKRLVELARVLFCTFEFPKSNTAARYITAAMVVTILVNALNVLMGSMPEFCFQPATCPKPVCDPSEPGAVCTKIICPPIENHAVMVVNAITVFIFTIDYVFRLCTVHTVPASILLAREVAIDIDGHLIDVSRVLKGGAWRKTWYFATSFMGVVDLLSILPFYVNIIIWYPRYSFRTSDPGLYDLTRVFRILRTLKLLRYSKQATLFKRTLEASSQALRFFIVMSFIVLLIFSSLVYYFEKGEFRVTPQSPDGAYYRRAPIGHHLEISPFDSMMTTLYWALINTTTLKSSIPISRPISRVLSILLAYAGVILLALPLSIIGRHFQKQYDLLNMSNEAPVIQHEASLPEAYLGPSMVGASVSDVSTRHATPAQQHSDAEDVVAR